MKRKTLSAVFAVLLFVMLAFWGMDRLIYILEHLVFH